MKLSNFIEDFVTIAKGKIIELAQGLLTNTEKKARLDDYLLTYVNNIMRTAPLNFVFKWVLKRYLIPFIPTFTQQIYDLIKIKVEGITKA